MSEFTNKNIWVFIETDEGKTKSVGLELLNPGRMLAEKSGEKLVAVVFGKDNAEAIEQIKGYGPDQIISVSGGEYEKYSFDAYTYAMTSLVEKYQPSAILIGATNNGRDLAPRMSGRMQNGVVADCTILTVDTEEGLVEWTRPALGGNILAEIISPNHRPQMGSVRPNVFKKPDRIADSWGRIQLEQFDLKPEDIRTKRLDFIPFSKTGYNIQEADIIVAGGRGMGSKENFDKLYELADAIGGVVGATRPLIEKGWIDLPYQVGQTGKTVSPKLYLAFGISGAIQHVSGISGADTIVAINNDPKAEIFQHANYGIVGDCMEVLNDMLAHLK